MRLFYALSSIVAIANAVSGNSNTQDPDNVLPQFECKNYYQKFSFASNLKDKRVCHGTGGQKRKRLYESGVVGWNRNVERDQFQTVVFDIEQIYDKSKDQTPVKYIELPVQFSNDIIDHLFRVESSESPGYLLAGRDGGDLYAIKDFPTATNYSWSLNITEGFNPRSGYRQFKKNSDVESIIQDGDSSTLLIGTKGSTIEILSDLNLETGEYANRGQLYFDSTKYCNKYSNRVPVGVYPRAVVTMAMSDGWIAAGTFEAGCGISIYPRTAIEDATQGPQGPAHVLHNEFLKSAVYSVVALKDGNMAVAASDPSGENCIVSHYDMTNITEPKLLGNVTSLGTSCSGGPLIEDENTDELLKGVSVLSGGPNKLSVAFTSFDLQNERVTSIADYSGSGEINALEALKDSNEKITRVATATDNSVHIFEVGGTFCKSLYTYRGQAKSLQQLADGSLAVGALQGRVALYSRDTIFGSCDATNPVADVILSSHQVIDEALESFIIMVDDTVVQVGGVPKNDPAEQKRYYLEIFDGEDIRSAVDQESSSVEIQPSAVIELPTRYWNLFGFGNTILVTSRYDLGNIGKRVCILNTDQLRENVSSERVVDTDFVCEWIDLPLTPDGGSRLGTPRFTSLSNSSFAVLSPGASDAPFKVQRYDHGAKDLNWVLSSSIDGDKMDSSRKISIITIQDECVAFPMKGQLYFANVRTNGNTTTLTFPSDVEKIDTIDDQLVVATVDGRVYMLDETNKCGYDAAQLDIAKGFSTDDARRVDVVEKLQDGSYAIFATYGGSEPPPRGILIYKSGAQFPFAQPDYFIHPLLESGLSVTGIDEFAAPGLDYNLNLVIYGEGAGSVGVFYPEGHPAFNMFYGSPPTPQSPSSPSPSKKVTPSPTMTPPPTKKVTPSPITPSPPAPDTCASIKNNRSCKKSSCKWKKSSRTCQKKLGDSQASKNGKRGKSPKKKK